MSLPPPDAASIPARVLVRARVPGPHPGPRPYPNWYHGNWHDNWNHPWYNYPAAWWTAGFVTGAALSNATPWSWGYWPYYNPYCTAPVVVGDTTIDYSQPIVLAGAARWRFRPAGAAAGGPVAGRRPGGATARRGPRRL